MTIRSLTRQFDIISKPNDRGSGNGRTALEMSVPRGPPPRCPSTGPREIVRMYVGTSPDRRVFIVPSHQREQRDVIAEIGPRGVSLSISIVRR